MVEATNKINIKLTTSRGTQFTQTITLDIIDCDSINLEIFQEIPNIMYYIGSPQETIDIR